MLSYAITANMRSAEFYNDFTDGRLGLGTDNEPMGIKIVIIVSNTKYMRVTKEKEMIQLQSKTQNKMGKVGA